MSTNLEAGLRILFVYYACAFPLAAAYGLITAATRRGRSGFIWLWKVLLLFALSLGWLMTSGALANNCGAGGGCEDIPDWDLGAAALVTGLPVMGVAFLTSRLQFPCSR